jgi:hypothetical protein
MSELASSSFDTVHPRMRLTSLSEEAGMSELASSSFNTVHPRMRPTSLSEEAA